MGIFRFLFVYAIAIVKWLLVEENREAGIRATKKGIDMLSEITSFTKTTKDDKAALYLAKKFEEGVKLNKFVNADKIAKHITGISKGSLKDVSIGIGGGKVNASIGDYGVELNSSDGSARFTFGI